MLYKSKKILIISLSLILFLPFLSFSQNNILYNMKNVPQSVNSNPAFTSNYRFYLGLPVLSSMYLDVLNTGFTYNDLFKPDTENGGYMFDIKNLLSGLEEKNYVVNDFQFALLSFGFKLRNDYFINFSANTKLHTEFFYSKGLFELANGNYREDQTPVKIAMGLSSTAYNEYGIGVSKKFNKQLYLGARIKFLRGIADIYSKKMGFDLYTATDDEHTYDWTINSDIEIYHSLPVASKPTYDETTGLFSGYDFDTTSKAEVKTFLGRNKGLAFDFGAVYDINDLFTVSASIVDLGSIKWSNNVNSIKQQGSYPVSGIDIAKYFEDYNSITDTTSTVFEDLPQNINDSVVGLMKPELGASSYKKSLYAKFYIGGSCHATKWLDASVLYRGYSFDGKLKSALTISANATFLRAWAASLSWSAMNGVKNNIGLGFAYNIGIFQFYILGDNIAAPLYPIDMKFSENLIKNTKQATVHFGINMVFRDKKDLALINNSRF